MMCTSPQLEILGCRREALRFRRGMEDVQEQLGAATEVNGRLQGQLAQASRELEAVEAFVNKRWDAAAARQPCKV